MYSKILGEHIVLMYCYECLTRAGLTLKMKFFDFNEEMLQEINQQYSKDYSLEDLLEFMRQNIAQGNLEYGTYDQNTSIRLTEKGQGIAISKSKQLNRNWFEKFSDATRTHSGIISTIAVFISLLSFLTSCIK